MQSYRIILTPPIGLTILPICADERVVTMRWPIGGAHEGSQYRSSYRRRGAGRRRIRRVPRQIWFALLDDFAASQHLRDATGAYRQPTCDGGAARCGS